MNIFKSLRIYATQNGKLYNSFKLWSEFVFSDLNESSMTCYPNGITGFSFGDRLNAINYITLAYLHRKNFLKNVKIIKFCQYQRQIIIIGKRL